MYVKELLLPRPEEVKERMFPGKIWSMEDGNCSQREKQPLSGTKLSWGQRKDTHLLQLAPFLPVLPSDWTPLRTCVKQFIQVRFRSPRAVQGEAENGAEGPVENNQCSTSLVIVLLFHYVMQKW